jgi:hypothetical protein
MSFTKDCYTQNNLGVPDKELKIEKNHISKSLKITRHIRKHRYKPYKPYKPYKQ